MAPSATILVIRWADKVIFLFALGLLVYVATGSFIVERTDQNARRPGDIQRLQNEVERLLDSSKPPPWSVPDLATPLEARMTEVPSAHELRRWAFHHPRPIVYGTLLVRVDIMKTRELREKLVRHTVEGDAHAVQVSARDEGDGTEVTALGRSEGKAKLVGYDHDGTRIELPFEVLPERLPPKVPPARQLTWVAPLGHSKVSWTGPTELPDGVKGVTWQIERRHEMEDEFRLIATTPQAETSCVDENIESGEIYLYRVRAKADTEDGEVFSPYTENIEVTAKSVVEFDLATVMGDRASIYVRRWHEGEWVRNRFTVKRGGLIGGLAPHDGAAVDFSTGCTLVDTLRNVPRVVMKTRRVRKWNPVTRRYEWMEVKEPATVFSSKIIYHDRKGVPREMWPQTHSESTVAPAAERRERRGRDGEAARNGQNVGEAQIAGQADWARRVE